MKMREPLPWFSGMARLLRCLFCLLLPALATDATPGPRTVQRPIMPCGDGVASSAYLPMIGPPPLRFAQGLPPPDLSTRPAPAAPPMPAVVDEIAAANTASAKSSALLAHDTGSGADQHRTTPVEAAPEQTVKRPSAKETPSLLPDENQREVRPEEILPFFQFPGSGGTAIVVPGVPVSPESTRLPVSSAVYREH
jgi:hypothetical protein